MQNKKKKKNIAGKGGKSDEVVNHLSPRIATQGSESQRQRHKEYEPKHIEGSRSDVTQIR
jgi:hypothetical protein